MLGDDFCMLARLSMPAVAMISDDGDPAGSSVVKGVATDNSAREIFALRWARVAGQHVENVRVLIVVGGDQRRVGGVLVDGYHTIRSELSL